MVASVVLAALLVGVPAAVVVALLLVLSLSLGVPRVAMSTFLVGKVTPVGHHIVFHIF